MTEGFTSGPGDSALCERPLQPVQFSVRGTNGAGECDFESCAAPLLQMTPAPNSAMASRIPAMISSTLMNVSRSIVGSFETNTAHRLGKSGHAIFPRPLRLAPLLRLLRGFHITGHPVPHSPAQ